MDLPEPRIADVDRDRVSEQLRVAYGEGRITEAELEERLVAVYDARTASDLSVVVADLPSVASLVPAQVAVAKKRRRIELWPAVPLLFPALVCTIIYLLTMPGGYFWPSWVWLGCGIPAFYAVFGGWADGDDGDDEDPSPPEVTA